MQKIWIFASSYVKWYNPGLDSSMGKCGSYAYPRKTRKNYQFYITVCFFYLASDLLSVVRQHDGKTDLCLPQLQKRNPIFLPLLHNFFFCLFKHHQPRISIYLSIYKITSFSNWNNWKKSDVLGLRVELDSSMG